MHNIIWRASCSRKCHKVAVDAGCRVDVSADTTSPCWSGEITCDSIQRHHGVHELVSREAEGARQRVLQQRDAALHLLCRRPHLLHVLRDHVSDILNIDFIHIFLDCSVEVEPLPRASCSHACMATLELPLSTEPIWLECPGAKLEWMVTLECDAEKVVHWGASSVCKQGAWPPVPALLRGTHRRLHRLLVGSTPGGLRLAPLRHPARQQRHAILRVMDCEVASAAAACTWQRQTHRHDRECGQETNCWVQLWIASMLSDVPGSR